MKKNNKKSFASNVFMLMASNMLIKMLGLVYRLAIMNVKGFGDLGNGYYSAGYQVYAVLLIISSQGIPGAVSKLVSAKVAKGEYNKAHRIFKLSMYVFGFIGLVCSLILLFGGEFIATNILNVSDVKYVLWVLSPAIVFVCVSAVIRGYFAGLGTMGASSTSQSLEQFFNCVLTITFVYSLVGKDAYIMAAGGNVSTTLAVLISFSYLLLFYKKNIKKYKEDSNDEVIINKEENKKIIKLIIMTAVPLTVGSVISVVTSFIDTVTVSNCIQIAYQKILPTKALLEKEAMKAAGILSKVDTLVNLPLAVNLSFYFALIPEITSLISKKDFKEAARKISSSIATSLFIIIPCAVGFIVLSKNILTMLYPNASDGALVLQIASITMILVAVNHTFQGSLFGLGKMYTPALALLCGSVVKIILNMILISNPNIGMYGAPISSFICQLVTFLIIYITLKKSISFKVDIKKSIFKPVLAAIIMASVILILEYILKNYIRNTILTLICIILGAFTYLLFIVILKVFTKEEILAFPFGSKIYKVLNKLRFYN